MVKQTVNMLFDPPSSIAIATPDVAVANAIKRLDLTCASNV